MLEKGPEPNEGGSADGTEDSVCFLIDPILTNSGKPSISTLHPSLFAK